MYAHRLQHTQLCSTQPLWIWSIIQISAQTSNEIVGLETSGICKSHSTTIVHKRIWNVKDNPPLGLIQRAKKGVAKRNQSYSQKECRMDCTETWLINLGVESFLAKDLRITDVQGCSPYQLLLRLRLSCTSTAVRIAGRHLWPQLVSL